VRPALRALEQVSAQRHSDEQHAEIQRLQWLIEELRVSLFAQDLRTAVPVSEKRIQEQIERAQAPTLKSIP
jgi:ATP-dependent helicase HrpA